MTGRILPLLVALAVSMGCASGPAARASGRSARQSAYLCKHCNCFMRGDTDPDARCPVCKCGHPARDCHRESRG